MAREMESVRNPPRPSQICFEQCRVSFVSSPHLGYPIRMSTASFPSHLHKNLSRLIPCVDFHLQDYTSPWTEILFTRCGIAGRFSPRCVPRPHAANEVFNAWEHLSTFSSRRVPGAHPHTALCSQNHKQFQALRGHIKDHKYVPSTIRVQQSTK